ncbi:MAG: AAA family ATPase [Lacisediminihabitans sp.]
MDVLDTPGLVTPIHRVRPDREHSAAPLVGRDLELEVLREFVLSLATSGAAVAMLGEPGSGKSALLDAAADLAHEAGLRVLSSAGLSADSHIAYGALDQLLLPIVDRIAGLEDQQRTALRAALGIGAGTAPEPLVLYNAVHSLLAVVADEAPLVLIVDDADHIDDASAGALSFLARRLSGLNVGILVASREPTALTVNRRIALGRLSRPDAESLLHAVEPDLPGHARAQVLNQAEGNPLALLEFVQHLRKSGHGFGEWRVAAPWAAVDTPSPFAGMLDALPGRTSAALLVLALDPHGDLRSLAAAHQTVGDLAPAERHGLVRVDAESLTARFTHPLIPSLVLARATTEERRDVHLILSSLPGSSLEDRAFHLAEAASDADEKTASTVEEAAAAAALRGDLSTASHLLTRAAHLSPLANDRQRRLARAAYISAEIPDETDVSSDLLRQARPTGGSPGSIYAAVVEAFAQLESGAGSRAAVATLRAAIESGSHGWDPSDAELIDGMNSWLRLCWTAGHRQEWQSFFAALKNLEPGVPEPLRTLSVAFADAAHASTWERVRVRQMLAEIGPDDDAGYILQLLTAAIFFDLEGTAIPAARRLVDRGRNAAETHLYVRSLALVSLHDYEAGRWQQAGESAREGLATVAGDRPTPGASTLFYVEALLAGARGDVQSAMRSVEKIDELAMRLDSLSIRRFGNHARVIAAAGQGDWETVYRQASMLSQAGRFESCIPHALRVAHDLVESAMRTGRVQEARAHYAAMVEAGLPAMSPRLALLTYAAGGLVDSDGRWEHAFERALGVKGAADWPFDYARVQLEFGTRLRRERRAADARQHLFDAWSTFERLGARPWADRAAAELRASGEHLRREEVSPALTAQEQAVAELAARGLTNKEIGQRLHLSARTVSGHLYRIFPKLGIRNRSSLRDALASEERYLA